MSVLSLKLIRAISAGMFVTELIGGVVLYVNGRYAEAALVILSGVLTAFVFIGVNADVQEAA